MPKIYDITPPRDWQSEREDYLNNAPLIIEVKPSKLSYYRPIIALLFLLAFFGSVLYLTLHAN